MVLRPAGRAHLRRAHRPRRPRLGPGGQLRRAGRRRSTWPGAPAVAEQAVRPGGRGARPIVVDRRLRRPLLGHVRAATATRSSTAPCPTRSAATWPGGWPSPSTSTRHAPGLRPAHRRARLRRLLPPAQAVAGRRPQPSLVRRVLEADWWTRATATAARSRSGPTPSATRWCARSSACCRRRPGPDACRRGGRHPRAAATGTACRRLAPPHGLCLWDVGYPDVTRRRSCRRDKPADRYRCPVASARPAVARCVRPVSELNEKVAACARTPPRHRDRTRVARRRCRGPRAGPPGHRGRQHPARQAQADLRPPHRHRRPRHRRSTPTRSCSPPARPSRSRSTATRATPAASRRTHLRRPARRRKPEEAIRRTIRGHAPQEPPRPPDAGKLKVYAGPTHPISGPAARSRSPRPRPCAALRSTETIRCPSRSSSPPVAASAPSPVSASARATARSPSTSAPLEEYFPNDTHRMILTEPLRVTETAERYDIDATHPRRRHLGSGRRPAPGHRPGPDRARSRAARRRSRRPASSPATPARRNPRSTA